jgi:hypothetical protein
MFRQDFKFFERLIGGRFSWRRRPAGDFSALRTSQKRRRGAGATKNTRRLEVSYLHFTEREGRKRDRNSPPKARKPV